MIKRLLHDVVKDNEDFAQMLEKSDVLPLVRELNHKYGLVVYEELKFRDQKNENFLLTDGQGLPIGRVFIMDGAYCYHAPYVSKERGSDDFDRHTFRSSKLSTLMSTLKRMNIVTSSDEVLKKYVDSNIQTLVSKVIGSFPYQIKNNLDGQSVHILLSAMKDGKSLNDFIQSDRDKYLELLDKYNQTDILSSRRKQGTEEMFKDTYLVLGDAVGHYIVAEATYEYTNTQEFKIKPKTPFKRVKDLTDYPRALSALTMNKVHLGEDFKSFKMFGENLVPMGDKYNSDLELVYGYRSRSSVFDMGCVCLSK